jgi:hypothetical protein
MSRDYKVNRRIIEPVEQWQYHSAQVTEHRINALLDERIDDYLCTGFERGFFFG